MVQILNEKIECVVIDERVDQNPSRLVIIVENVLAYEVLEQWSDIDDDVDVVVVDQCCCWWW